MGRAVYRAAASSSSDAWMIPSLRSAAQAKSSSSATSSTLEIAWSAPKSGSPVRFAARSDWMAGVVPKSDASAQSPASS